ncbi:MAG: LysE family translocator [Candidatus Dormiibacterota bacterium]
MDARLLSFIVVAALLVIAPGPDMALVSRNALRGGVRLVAPTVLGVGTGTLGWSAASALGLATLLDRAAVLFSVLRLLGAAYLCLLGVLALRSALRRRTDERSSPRPAEWAGPVPRRRAAYVQGLVNNLLNPKAGVIFLTLFPQFLRPGDGPSRIVVMVAVFEGLLVGWLLVYGRTLAGLGASRAGRRLQRGLEAMAGVVLCGLGIRVAWETWRGAA